jgi:hypothetical protein
MLVDLGMDPVGGKKNPILYKSLRCDDLGTWALK